MEIVGQSSKDRVRDILIGLAGEMIRGKNMPSEFSEDWDLPISTPVSVTRKITSQSRTTRNQCIEWSISLRKAYDILTHE